VGDIDVEIPDISMPDINIPDFSPSTKPEPEKPVDNNQSGIVDDVVEKTYHYPLNGEVIKGFSVDALVFSETLGDYRVHTGIDISGEKGSAVCAYTDGKILDIYDDPLMGKTVAIQHEYDMVSYYSNLASELPADIVKGKEVKSGDIIGAVGTTALCEIGEDSHIHFEIKVGNTFIDPTPELSGAIKK
jgi:murein DD-endopeptidase MepM/ murein hydrolase activator NlpD